MLDTIFTKNRSINLPDEQLIIWRPYLDLIGEENFIYDDQGFFNQVFSKFYCGPNPALAGINYFKLVVNSSINRYQQFKALTQLSPKMSIKQIEHALSYCHPVYRGETLLELLQENLINLDPSKAWDCIIEAWVFQEDIVLGANPIAWKELFSLIPPIPRLTSGLPKTMTIYRGGYDEDGLSWTLSKTIAERFNERKSFISDDETPSKVLEKVIQKEDVLFFTDIRGEKEIVILPK